MTQKGVTLIIGYGNEIRGDDAAGVVLANRIAERNVADVNVLTSPQLLPEMVAEIPAAARVFFCDAALQRQRPYWQRLRRAQTFPTASWCGNHVQSPMSLLYWTWLLYDIWPGAWWIQLPASHFELGESLSETCLRGVQCAEGQLLRLLARPAGPISCMSSA